MRIVVASDEDLGVLRTIVGHLAGAGHDVTEAGAGLPWPQAGRVVGEAVAGGAADLGVVCCWTGTGVAMAANKVAGVRAALCADAYTAEGARRWNDANVLALSLRTTTDALAREILDAFLAGAPEPSEAANIAAVEPGRVLHA